MGKGNTLTKIAIYTGNYLARPIGNTFKKGLNLGNPSGAIFYGILDISNASSKKVKESKFNRLTKAVGTGIYGVFTITNLFSILKGNYDVLAELPFNASMTYSLGKDVVELYKSTEKETIKKVNKENDFFKDVKSVYNDISNFIKNKDKGLERKLGNSEVSSVKPKKQKITYQTQNEITKKLKESSKNK